ncbi:MAG: cupin domain-containing protein [Tatlockia sp.]|nr:cupin domain-containing protein [Tatlockia sp.]
MDALKVENAQDLIHELIAANGNFPNNSRFPLMIYRQVFPVPKLSPESIQSLLHHNQWINSWVNGIYDYHHYHSNTHEALIICAGSCNVQIGGFDGKIYEVFKGDAIIFPAGVSHKNVGSTRDFLCVGSYPLDIKYDMNYGLADEHPKVDLNISQVNLPASDPIYGVNGILFNYWK